jgi:hypothetical protein
VNDRLIPEPSDRECNAAVLDGRSLTRARPCRLPPRALGLRGRLLCKLHLREEAARAAWDEEVRSAAQTGAALVQRLGRVLPGTALLEVNLGSPRRWRGADFRPRVVIYLDYDGAADLCGRLARATVTLPEMTEYGIDLAPLAEFISQRVVEAYDAGHDAGRRIAHEEA